jgi:hypothetical protein
MQPVPNWREIEVANIGFNSRAANRDVQLIRLLGIGQARNRGPAILFLSTASHVSEYDHCLRKLFDIVVIVSRNDSHFHLDMMIS